MLDNAVAGFLDEVTEREFDEPLLALLRENGFVDIHYLHGSYEFGKDVIAKGEAARSSIALRQTLRSDP